MRAALLLGSDRTLKAWEYEALELAVQQGLDITTVLHCTNDHHPPRKIQHAAYHALAAASRTRLPMLRERDVTTLLANDVKVHYFRSEWDGESQQIPGGLAEQLAEHDVVVKFGMNLLHAPEDLPVTYGVVAYHDAHPEAHRGRPHGLLELTAGQATMTVSVQQLNTSDGARILAEAHSRVVPTSYRATLKNAYESSIPLLAKAIGVLKNQQAVGDARPESNHQLPTNGQVVKTLGKMATALVGRGLYGAFREKRWNVAFVPQPFNPENPVQPQFADMQPIILPEGYTFAADPCAYHNGRLYVEVMHGGTGKGEIFAYTDDGHGQRVDLPVGGGHLSYPQILEYEGVTYLFPEMGDVGPPTFFELDEEQLASKAEHQLLGLENERIIDPTLIEHERHWYLFGGGLDDVGERLELWVSDSPFGPWTPHSQTPVCLDPRSARMAGPVIRANGKLYRTGQDGSVSYGRGVTISRIEKLTPTEFEETRLSSFTIQGAYGPHTILPTEDGYWLDYYTEQTTPMAGVRRVKGRLK